MDKAVVVVAGGGLGKALMARLPRSFETVGLTHRELDISRRNDVLTCLGDHKPDVVFNAAGLADVDTCESDRWQAYLVNRDGAKHLAQAASEAGAQTEGRVTLARYLCAIVAARRLIVEGAVGIVELALARLAEKNVVQLDPERKAQMVTNLLVVLCGERSAQPVINAGSIYQ